MGLAVTIIGYVIQGLTALAPLLEQIVSHLPENHPSTAHLAEAAKSLADVQNHLALAKKAAE